MIQLEDILKNAKQVIEPYTEKIVIQQLPVDVLAIIKIYLSDKDMIRLLSTYQIMNTLKIRFAYNDQIHLQKIPMQMDGKIQDVYFVNDIKMDDLITLPYYKNIKNIHYHSKSTSIPCMVTHLSFSDEFNKSLKNKIPTSVTHLTFGDKYDQPIRDTIPHSVLYLKFGYDFNQAIKNNLPSSITHLKFGCKFNQPIKNSLPGSILYLTFGDRFDQPIRDSIPPSVTHLKFGSLFDHPLTGNIPKSVTHITLGEYFGAELYPKDCKIPNNVYHLTIEDDENARDQDDFYEEIKNIFDLSPSITHLVFGDKFNMRIQKNMSSSLTHLTFGTWFNRSIKNSIPDSVTHLTFGSNFDKPIKNNIPSSVTHLTMGTYFNQPIKNAIPSSVTRLFFASVFNQPIYNSIPPFVKHLSFGYKFNQEIKGNIPSSVTHLYLADKMNKYFIADGIPNTVKYLILPSSRKNDINPNDFSMRVIWCDDFCNYRSGRGDSNDSNYLSYSEILKLE
uniref:F-box domain-containing protein n=1 Tax=viral metagenome TaxID=1070528 RepID=A0A6C0CCH2_9ZZZZ